MFDQKTMELNRRIAEYENKMALLSQEIERLNVTLRGKVEEISGLEQRNRSLQHEYEISQKRMSEEITIEWRNKITVYEQQVTTFQQENEELRRRLR